MNGYTSQMNGKDLNPYESPESPGEQGPAAAPSFLVWFGFSVSIAVIILLFRLVSKLLERLGATDLHWLTGRGSMKTFLISHAIFIATFSILISLTAYIRKLHPPGGD
ncbi:hypothetical protein OAG68_02370 [bacterium]|nr:hypothetical protein [bacterium]